MKKLIGMVVMGSLLLGACSEEVVKEETKEANSAPVQKEKTKKEIVEVDYSEYLNNMSRAMSNISDDLGSITEQSIKLSENPYLQSNQDWLIDTAMALTSFDESIQEVRNIEEPTQPELKEAHTLVLAAMDHYQFTVDNYPDAIDNMDSGLLDECTANINKATEKIQAATNIIEGYKQSL